MLSGVVEMLVMAVRGNDVVVRVASVVGNACGSREFAAGGMAVVSQSSR